MNRDRAEIERHFDSLVVVRQTALPVLLGETDQRSLVAIGKARFRMLQCEWERNGRSVMRLAWRENARLKRERRLDFSAINLRAFL